MFMLRMFKGSSPASEPDHPVVDVASPAPAEQLNLRDNAHPVIAVSDRDDGFADVAVRPLTYAEVASLTANNHSAASKVYLDQSSDEDEDDEDAYLSDSSELELSDSVCSSTEESDELADGGDAADGARLYVRRASNDVLGEMEYGERAKDLFLGLDRKHLAKKAIIHQTPLAA